MNFEKKEITSSMIDKAIEAACKKAEQMIPLYDGLFMTPCTKDFKYGKIPENRDWICGMQTGVQWYAYYLTGEKKFRDAAEKKLDSFYWRLTQPTMNTHDVGFLFSPSCIAAYKLCGNEKAREAAIKAAELLMHYRFMERDGFIMRGGYRIIVDTMLNIPLLFWAAEETGNEKFKEAAISHYRLTEKYLIRKDNSTYHHFEINEETGEPIRGVTLQGNGDESCWSRGHSWTVYGYPLAYSYTKNSDTVDAFRRVGGHFLKNIPTDGIPYWDFDFKEGDDAPRDASAGAISVCGFDEALKLMPLTEDEKALYESAKDYLMHALVTKCINYTNEDAEGIIFNVTHALPQGQGINECGVYGDFFMMEALARYKNKDFIRFW